jgi:hypothetical protein
MSVFKSYKIEGNDLFLEEYLFWTFSPDQQEAVQVWTLTSVDNNDLDTNRLDQLIAYQEDAESELEVINGRTKLTISTWLDSEYVFHCDNLSNQKRPYNVEELTEFLLSSQKNYQKQSSIISKQSQFIEKLTKFIENEIEKKIRIIDSVNNSDMKANHQFDILNQLKTFIDNHRSDLKTDTI